MTARHGSGTANTQAALTPATAVVTPVHLFGDPADTVAKVIAPYRKAATEAGKEHLVLATRWTVLAASQEEAWQSLSSMRGLRAPGRLEATDPQELRIKADEMDPADVLSSYTVIPDAEGLVNAYHPLVTDVGADIVSIQVMSTDPMATIELIGKEVLPEFKDREQLNGRKKAERLAPIIENAMKRKRQPSVPKHDGPTIVTAAPLP